MFQIVFSFIFIFCFIWNFAKTKQKSTSSHTWVSFLPTRPSVTHRSFLFPTLHESTPVGPSVGGCEPVDAAPIDGILPSLSAAQQMAGGLGSPDIHHCLAVRCSRSSALTSRPVPRTSLPPPLRGPPSNDAAKWGAFSPAVFFFFFFLKCWHTQLCRCGCVLLSLPLEFRLSPRTSASRAPLKPIM